MNSQWLTAIHVSPRESWMKVRPTVFQKWSALDALSSTSLAQRQKSSLADEGQPLFVKQCSREKAEDLLFLFR